MTIDRAIEFFERDEHGQPGASSLFRGGLPDFYEELRDEQSRCEALYEGAKWVARRLRMRTDSCSLDLSKKVLRGGAFLGEYRVQDVSGGTVGVPMVEVERCTVDGEALEVKSERAWREEVDADWRTSRAGDEGEAPTVCVLLREGLIRLDRFPHESVEGLESWLEGPCLPPPFVWETHQGMDMEEFDLPQCAHMPTVLIAAGIASGLVASSEDAFMRVASMVGDGPGLSQYRSAFQQVDEIALSNVRAATGDCYGKTHSEWLP